MLTGSGAGLCSKLSGADTAAAFEEDADPPCSAGAPGSVGDAGFDAFAGPAGVTAFAGLQTLSEPAGSVRSDGGVGVADAAGSGDGCACVFSSAGAAKAEGPAPTAPPTESGGG